MFGFLQDATANDIRDKRFDVKGFPTMYLHTSSGKVIAYEGDRSKDDIITFINKYKDSAEQSKLATDANVETDSKDEL